jgi:hypothetical protein
MQRLLKIVALAFSLSLSCTALASGEFIPIDLEPYGNLKLSENLAATFPGVNLKELPTGEQMFGNCKFKIGERLIQLGSRANAIKKTMPEKVDGIKVGRKLAKLHILHATQCGGGKWATWEVPMNTLIGEYRVNFDDHTGAILPIVFGKDMEDWYFKDDNKKLSRGRVVWEGDSEFAKASGGKVRLYAVTWENPWPDKMVRTIDFSSRKKHTVAAPFCVAITAEA